MRKLRKALILAGFLQVALDAQDVFKGGAAAVAAADQVTTWQRATNNDQRSTFFANFKVAKMLKFGRQGAQVEQVDGSVDFSGFGSRCSRCSSCFKGNTVYLRMTTSFSKGTKGCGGDKCSARFLRYLDIFILTTRGLMRPSLGGRIP